MNTGVRQGPVIGMEGAPLTGSAAAAKARNKRPSRTIKSSSIFSLFFYSIVALVLVDGWLNRDDALITAEHGIGYLFGIIGGVLMLLMLLYSVRKRSRFMRRMGKVSSWFRMHMMFGVLGPSFIIYHSNFSLGSLNSTIALFSMLLVALSGLVGRYIYAHIHYGLYGEKATVASLRDDNNVIMQKLARKVPFSASLVERLKLIEDKTLRPPRTVIHAVFRHAFVSVKFFFIYRSLLGYAKELLREKYKNREMSRQEVLYSKKLIKSYVRAYLARLHKVSELSFFERLFSIWHVVHVPFFIMMIITGIVHVFAVHVY